MSESNNPSSIKNTHHLKKPSTSSSINNSNNNSLTKPKTKKPVTGGNGASSLTEKSSILHSKSNPHASSSNSKGSKSRTKNDPNNSSVNIESDTNAGAGSPPEGDLNQLVEMSIEQQQEEGRVTSSLAHTSFNYINSILGSGVIGMPYALHQAGIGLGLILMIFIAIITDYSLRLMIRSGQLSGSFSYQGMMEIAFGRAGFYLLTILQLIYPFIAMVSYNVIVGDTFTKILGYFYSTSLESLNLQRETIVFVVTLFVTLPLSLYRNVARMSKVSLVSLLAIGFILMAILVRFATVTIAPTQNAWSFGNTGLLQAIGIYSFAFMCHHNTFMIYGSMSSKSEPKWNKVTHISIGTALAVSLIFGLAGYATFTGLVQGDLLENYCWDDNLINISRGMFAITIMLTFPLECFVVRDVIGQVAAYKNNAKLQTHEEARSSTFKHFTCTFVIVMTACILSMSTDCLGVTLELNGLLAAIPLAYILPAACYIKLEPSKFWSKTKLPAVGVALFGLVVSISGLIVLITRGSSEENCMHGGPLPYCANLNPIYSNSTIFLNSTTLPSASNTLNSTLQ